MSAGFDCFIVFIQFININDNNVIFTNYTAWLFVVQVFFLAEVSNGI